MKIFKNGYKKEWEKRACRQAEFEFDGVDNVRILLQGGVFDHIFRKSQKKKILSIEMDIWPCIDGIVYYISKFSNESIFVD